MNKNSICHALASQHCLMLLIFIAALSACSTVSSDLVPINILPLSNSQTIEGSVNVQTKVFPKEDSVHCSEYHTAWADNDKFGTALKTAIVQKRLFSKIEQGNADYVLDVWADFNCNSTGRLTPIFEVDSIWRLTRVKDRKVLVCDFVHSTVTSSDRLITKVIEVMRETIQNGLVLLADRSTAHLSALSIAGIRPSMGPVVLPGYTQWAEKIRQNWSKLRIGLSLEEVESFIGPVNTSGAILRSYTQGYTQGYDAGIYTLIFINGKLSRWELR